MKNPIQLLLSQEGNASAYLVYTGMVNDDLVPGQEYIDIFTAIKKVFPGLQPKPQDYEKQKAFRVDNTTPVPVVDVQGQPVMITEEIYMGLDANGQPMYSYQQIQKTIGEYDKTVWEHFDDRNPAPKQIAAAIKEAITRKLTGDNSTLVFVQTQAWLDTLES